MEELFCVSDYGALFCACYVCMWLWLTWCAGLTLLALDSVHRLISCLSRGPADCELPSPRPIRGHSLSYAHAHAQSHTHINQVTTQNDANSRSNVFDKFLSDPFHRNGIITGLGWLTKKVLRKHRLQILHPFWRANFQTHKNRNISSKNGFRHAWLGNLFSQSFSL